MRWKPIHGSTWTQWSSKFREFLKSCLYPHEKAWTDSLLSMSLILVGLNEDDEIEVAMWFTMLSPQLAELHICASPRVRGRWLTVRAVDDVLDLLRSHGVRAVLCFPSTHAHRSMVLRLGFEDHGALAILELYDTETSQGVRTDSSP